MKFLDDAKNAKFATDLLAAAGFSLEDLRKAGDANALKDAIAKTAVTGPTAEELEAAVKENIRLEASVKDAAAEITKLKTSAQASAQIGDALAANGIKLSEVSDEKGFSAAKFDEAFTLAVAKASRIALARAGHAAIDEEVAPVISGKPEKAPEGYTGRDRVSFAFNQQLSKSRN